jgi:hypothetical protein
MGDIFRWTRGRIRPRRPGAVGSASSAKRGPFLGAPHRRSAASAPNLSMHPSTSSDCSVRGRVLRYSWNALQLAFNYLPWQPDREWCRPGREPLRLMRRTRGPHFNSLARQLQATVFKNLTASIQSCRGGVSSRITPAPSRALLTIPGCGSSISPWPWGLGPSHHTYGGVGPRLTS